MIGCVEETQKLDGIRSEYSTWRRFSGDSRLDERVSKGEETQRAGYRKKDVTLSWEGHIVNR